MYKHVEHSLIEQMLTLLSVSDDQSVNGGEYEAARQLKVFIDEIPGGFMIYHADGDEELIYANKALLKIFRCENYAEFKKLTGNSFKGVVYREDLEEVENSIKQQIASSQDDLDYVEYRILRKDGVIRWVEDYGHFVSTKSVGDIYYVFISDATEKIKRRNSERTVLLNATYEKEKKLQNLIEEYDKERKLIRQEHLRRLEVIEGLSVNYDSILYTDVDEDKVLPYRVSSRFEDIMGRRLCIQQYSTLVENYVKKWVHPEDAETVTLMLKPETIRKKLADSQTFYFNYRCKSGNEMKYLQLRIADVGNGGRASQVVMGFRNIDEEVLQEMEQKKLLLEALNNAKLAYIAKNTFLSNMSHDMRTPLNAIFGYTALAKKNADDAQTVNAYLEKIETAGKQILDLVEKVLEVSYIESQEFHVNEKPCNVLDIANEVFNSVVRQADKKNLNISLHSETVEHAEIFADEDKLKQILSHIAGNSVKYTDKGGKIDFYIEERKSTLNDYATYRFIMKDTGVGISKDYLARIFDPFERERNSTHSGVFGSGLGLTIAKHIIDMMGGKIQAESKVGEGSTFTVTLSFRLQDCAPAVEDSSDDFTEKLKNKKVLVVEDNEINLEIETVMLEDLQLEVEPAENGKIAVEKISKAKAGEYLFVLMDIQMPVMDGRQAAEQIRKLKDPALASIPIIALSANAFESDKRMSLEAGIDAHIHKPIDIPVLLKTLEQTLKTRGVKL